MSDNKVTLDQLDSSAVEAMSSSVGDVSMLNTENKTIVGALAEIVGKKEIANAIGEPLAETDKFIEMSSEINGLLSTFKTNMMNAGVVVESGDKFKALIDKIKGLTEGEGKGVQIVSGVVPAPTTSKTFTYALKTPLGETSTVSSSYVTINLQDLNFTPSLVMAYSYGETSEAISVLYNAHSATGISTPIIRVSRVGLSSNNTVGGYCVLPDSSFSNGILNMPVDHYYKYPDYEWVAIGVGEEDNTLRDSLASILEDEGVEVLEEDTMADLIIKTNEEFDRKNANKGLDIISATKLPATGRENQICVITNNPVDNFRISNLQTDILNDGNIYLKLGSGSGSSSGNITLGDTVQTIYHVDGIYQNGTKLKSYVYQDGNWIEFTKIGIEIMVNGSYTVDSETYGTLKERSGTSGSITFTDGNGLWMNYGLVSSGRYGHMHTYLTKKIDISGFTKVKVTLKDMDYGGTASTNMIATLHFFDSAPTASLLTNPDEDDDYPSKSQSIGRVDFTSKEIVYNISDMTGSYYLDFEIYTPSNSSGYYVDVRLTDFSIE